ncbi:hypothetical protein [Rhizobium leguminosarum]
MDAPVSGDTRFGPTLGPATMIVDGEPLCSAAAFRAAAAIAQLIRADKLACLDAIFYAFDRILFRLRSERCRMPLAPSSPRWQLERQERRHSLDTEPAVLRLRSERCRMPLAPSSPRWQLERQERRHSLDTEPAVSPMALEAVKRTDALFDIEREINGPA